MKLVGIFKIVQALEILFRLEPILVFGAYSVCKSIEERDPKHSDHDKLNTVDQAEREDAVGLQVVLDVWGRRNNLLLHFLYFSEGFYQQDEQHEVAHCH